MNTEDPNAYPTLSQCELLVPADATNREKLARLLQEVAPVANWTRADLLHAQTLGDIRRLMEAVKAATEGSRDWHALRRQLFAARRRAVEQARYAGRLTELPSYADHRMPAAAARKATGEP